MLIFGVRKLAKELGVTPITVYRYIEKGMPYKQISEKKRAFDMDEIKTWINEKEKQTNE